MRYHNITKDDMLNGDGLRVVLWVAGCDHCCKECHNPVTWDPNGGLFFDEKADIVRPTGALYIQNLDGEKDAEGMVRSYFPSSRGFKSARYTLALYIDRENHKLVKSLLFDDEKDPYQMNNLSLEENQEVVKDLCAEMGKVLKEIDDPWYTEKILSDRIPY